MALFLLKLQKNTKNEYNLKINLFFRKPRAAQTHLEGRVFETPDVE